MTTKIQFLDKYIEGKLLEENAEKEKNHTPSGKLSASMLGQPLQWQILHVIGVPKDKKEEFVLRKFQRGNDVEEWLVKYIPGLVNKQKFVEYRNVVGYVDAIADMRDWGLEQFGTIPHEIKSVSNLKYKRIQKMGADEQHILQACLYALALGTEHFALDYVASDDYRVETHMFDTKDYKQQVCTIIDDFDKQIASKFVPEFVSVLDWQNNDKYSPYVKFKGMGMLEIDAVLEKEYPEAFKKLKGIK